MSHRRIVIGAGISGASTAYHLKRAGAETLLLLSAAKPRAAAPARAPRSSARATPRRC